MQLVQGRSSPKPKCLADTVVAEQFNQCAADDQVLLDLPVGQDGAILFFQLINARHERASTVLTSNKGFEDWGSVLGDEVMAAALIDRLLHHCHIVNIRGNSYRMRAHQDLVRSRVEEDGTRAGAA